jgi:hypothetical protein
MFRYVAWLAVLLTGCGLMLLWDAAPGHAAAFPSAGWILGLLLGLASAWLYRVDWSTVPERLEQWVRVQRRRLGWALLGSVCLVILLYF